VATVSDFPPAMSATRPAAAPISCSRCCTGRRLCCGRPLIEMGWADAARRQWRRTLDTLADDIAAGVPVVGVEPSCTVAFRDELVALFPDDPVARRLSAQTRSLGELLAETGHRPPPRQGRVLYHHHCQGHAVLDADREPELLRRMGLDVEVLDSGCCGMAGSFGFERDKYDLSVALASRVLLPAIRAAPDALVVADGFSCREQLRQLTGVRPLHLAEIMRDGAAPTRPLLPLR